MSPRSIVPALALLLLSCLAIPASPIARDAAAEIDAPAPPRVISIHASDARGDVWPDDAIPRAPEIVIRTSTPIDESAVFLLTGTDGDDLREDLAAAPLRATTLARAWPHERTVASTTIRLRPAMLERGASIVVAIGAWARDGWGRALGAPVVVELRAATDERSGARAIDAWPPDGASGIGTGLSMAAVRFDGAITTGERAIEIEGPDGAAVPAITRGARCDEIGWIGEHCVIAFPSRPLAPGARHAVRVRRDLRDATGAIVPPFAARFTTGGADTTAPTLRLPACAVDELAVEDLGCVLADDAHLEIRLAASEPARLRALAGMHTVTAVAPRGEATLSLQGLGPASRIAMSIEVIDSSGNVARLEHELATTEPLAALSIVAVRADPAGAEPRQEYVELRNQGAVAIDLEGFAISDSAGSEGDRIAGSHLLAPGASALVVSSEFDPEDAADPPIPPGIALVRVDRSIGSGGLSNAGEPLFLRDPAGHRVSAAPDQPPPREGVCLVRTASDLRTGAVGSFEYDREGGCAPGRDP